MRQVYFIFLLFCVLFSSSCTNDDNFNDTPLSDSYIEFFPDSTQFIIYDFKAHTITHYKPTYVCDYNDNVVEKFDHQIKTITYNNKSCYLYDNEIYDVEIKTTDITNITSNSFSTNREIFYVCGTTDDLYIVSSDGLSTHARKMRSNDIKTYIKCAIEHDFMDVVSNEMISDDNKNHTLLEMQNESQNFRFVLSIFEDMSNLSICRLVFYDSTTNRLINCRFIGKPQNITHCADTKTIGTLQMHLLEIQIIENNSCVLYLYGDGYSQNTNYEFYNYNLNNPYTIEFEVDTDGIHYLHIHNSDDRYVGFDMEYNPNVDIVSYIINGHDYNK